MLFAFSACRYLKPHSALVGRRLWNKLSTETYNQNRNVLQRQLCYKVNQPHILGKTVLRSPQHLRLKYTSGAADKAKVASKPSLWRVLWHKSFGKYLLLTNTLSSGILMVVGDWIAQEIQYRHATPRAEWQMSWSNYDWPRLGRMFIVGAIQGPLHHYVYNWMDRMLPEITWKNIMRKILIDQLLMSPICILAFFYSACFLERKTLEATNMELIAKFPYIYLLDWAVWPAAQYINFRYLETKYRVIYVNIVTAIYNVYISYMKHEFDIENL